MLGQGQTQKATCYMIPFYKTYWKSRNCRNKTLISGFQELGVVGEVHDKSNGEILRNDKIVLYLDAGVVTYCLHVSKIKELSLKSVFYCI